ncbi:MAG: RNA-guided endonuclease InsQ/TnpB family protein, partial [Caldisericum sp.]
MTKAERIKNTIQKTKEYRKTLKPVTFQLKLQNLSKRKKETLERAFLEAKWFYNWLVSNLNRLNLPVNKIKTVEVKIGNTFEERPLTILGSQVKQEIANRLKDNLKSLAVLKKNGHKVGCLKPKKF